MPVLLNTVAHVDPKYGGIVSSLSPLCSALSSAGRYTASIAAFCSAGEEDSLPEPRAYKVHCFPLGRFRWAMDSRLRRSLSVLVESASVVHVHGLWQEHCALAAALCRQLKKPLIISAHGMLDVWSLHHKAWKKKVYLALRHRKHLEAAACLRALTTVEAEDYRRLGLTAPIAVIPNGVAGPPDVNPEEFFERYPHLRHKTILLFLGRLHPKKGVFLLVETWARICRRYPDAHLVLAGPDSEHTREPLVRLIRGLSASSAVTLTGMLAGPLKWSAYSAAHIFVLPSYSEGFSVSALEAMAAGCPVLLSHQCHFPEVQREACGWVIDPRPEPLQAAIAHSLELDAAALCRLQTNCRKLVAARYEWTRISGQMTEVCDWLTGGKLPASTEILFAGTHCADATAAAGNYCR